MAPPVGTGEISVAFVRPSVRPSVRRVYIANNARTQRHRVPIFGRKVPHLRCYSNTSFKVKRSNVRVRGGRGHIVSTEPGGHTACYYCVALFVVVAVSACMCLVLPVLVRI